MSLRVGAPSFGGHAETLTVGRRSYGLPPGCRVERVTTPTGQLAYVLDGHELHVLTPSGEVYGIPSDLIELAREQYFATV